MGQSPSTLIYSIKTTPKELLVDKVNSLLVNGGVDVNVADENGKTALHFGAVEGLNDLVTLLLDAGANPNVKDNYDLTPVADAAFRGQTDCVKILVEKGKADLSIANRDGMTPLHWAVENKKYECVDFLIKHGANPTLLNAKDQSIFDICNNLKIKQKKKMEEVIKAAISDYNLSRGVTVSALENFSKVRTHRLAALCKLWGTVKYLHPFLVRKGFDWDNALTTVLPLASSALSLQEFHNVAEKLLSLLGDANTYTRAVVDIQEPPSPIITRPMSKNLVEQPYVKFTTDNIAVMKATNHEQLNDFQKMLKFLSAFKEANSSKSTAIIFDVRLKVGNPLINSYPLKFMFFEAFRGLLDKPLNLPSYRQRMFNGLPQQRNFGNVFHSGVYTQEGEQILPGQPEEDPDTPGMTHKRPWIFVINNETPEPLLELAMAVQSAGLGKVIFETDNPDVEPGIPTITLPLHDALVAHIRTAERLNADGTIGFIPDMTTQAPLVKSKKDSTLGQIYQYIRDGKYREPYAPKTSVPAYVHHPTEQDYFDNSLPDKEHRLLALFKYWNAVRYFFAYRELIERNWDEVLLEFIPKIEKAKGDSHATVVSSALNDHMGTHVPPIELKTVEDKTVVSYVWTDPQTDGLPLGVEIIAVDNDPITTRKLKLASVIPASTPQSLDLKVHQRLLAGPKDTVVLVKMKLGKEAPRVIQFVRSHPIPLVRAPEMPQFYVIPNSGYGYIDCVNLKLANVETAMNTIRFTPALILDMRGHPKGTIYQIASKLTSKKVTVAVTQTPLLLPQFMNSSGECSLLEEKHVIHPGTWKYEGRVVALISGETVSQAEHYCLYLKECANVTFIGTKTSGSNGNVTNLALPGGVLVAFTGLGVLQADKAQLQRKGISPQIEVSPTLSDVYKGRDEILDAALQYLKTELSQML